MTPSDNGGTLTKEQQLAQQLKAALDALNSAKAHGMPESQYMSAMNSLKTRYQEQTAQMTGQGDPFVQGLMSGEQSPPVSVAAVNRDSYQSRPAPALPASPYQSFKERQLEAATHSPGSSNFLAGLEEWRPGGVMPPTPEAIPIDEQKLARMLADMQAKNAPPQAIEQVKAALDRQNAATHPPSPLPGPAPSSTPTPAPTPTSATTPASVQPTSTPANTPSAVLTDAQKLANELAEMQAKNAPYEAIEQVKAALTKQNEYDKKKQALLSDNTLDPWDKNLQLQSLDDQYGKTQKPTPTPAPVVPWQNPVDVSNAAKLKSITDQINELDTQILEAGKHMSTEGMLPSLQAKRKALVDQLGSGVNVDDYGYGGVDQSKIVDVKLGNKDIGNVSYSNGVATGNIEDVVGGLGGQMKWNPQHTGADIRDADGNVIGTISISGDKAYETDRNGNIINQYAVKDGHVQVDVVRMGDILGVPLSYYHDKNGAFHAYAQPEMRGAPAQMVRRENQVYIDVYVDFEGKNANDIYPGTEKYDPSGKIIPGSGKTYAQLVYDGINTKWNPTKSFNIGGFVPDKDGKPLKDQNGNFVYAENDTVNIHTRIHSNYSQTDGKLTEPANLGHKAVKINIDNNSILPAMFGLTSHVTTEDPKDLLSSGMTALQGLAGGRPNLTQMSDTLKTGGKMVDNFVDALLSDQPVRLMDNWSINDPGQVWLYDRGKNVHNQTNPQYNDPDWYSNTAGHEFGHVMGLSDAYPAFYRYNAETPEFAMGTNEYGNSVLYQTPRNSNDWHNTDMMLSNGQMSDNDARMLLQAQETGNPQFFPRDPQQEKDTKEKWLDTVFNILNLMVHPY